MAADGKIIGTDVIDQSAHDAVIQLTKESDDLLKKYVELAGGITSFRAALGNVKGYKDVTDAINGQKEKMTELEKIKRQLVTANEKLIASQTLEAQLLAELKIRQTEDNKAARDFINSKKLQEGSIDQLNVQLVKLKKEYAALSEAERNAAKGKELLVHLQGVRENVGKLEATMGMYHKNVGNYTNATFQMTQVLREVPNFAQSAEVGIRSLSNNLPMLFDAFGQVRKEAGGTGPALKVFANSLMSFSSIFPLVLTFFIKYQEQIFDFITGTTKAEKETKKLTSSLDESQKAFVSAAESAGAERVQMLQLYSIATDVNLAMKTRLDATNELQRLYPSYLKNISDESIMAGDAADAFDRLNRALLQKAVFKGFEAQATEQGKGLSALIMQREAMQKEYEKLLGGDKKVTSFGGKLLYDITSTDIKSEQAALTTRTESLKTQIELLDKNILLTESSMMRTIETMKKYADMSNTIDSLDNTKAKKPKKEKEAFKMDVPDLTPTQEELKNIDSYYQRMSDEIKKLWNQYFNSVEFKDSLSLDEKELMGHMDALTTHTGDKSGTDATALNTLLMGRRKQAKTDDKDKEERTKAYFNLVSSGLQSVGIISNAIYERENAQITAKEKKMNDYYDAEEARIKKSGLSQQKKEEELMKLSAQKEAQQKKIDVDRANAQRKAAARQKAIDIIQIIANTALAVTSALKEGDPYTKLARAAAAGLLGGAQLAAVIATPLPQYADGTDNHPGGFAQVSERGPELGILPDGRKFLTPEKTTIMNLPARTKIIPHEELMKRVYDVAMVKLANSGQKVNENSMSIALQESFNELSGKVEKLTKIMSGKKYATNIYSDYDHNLHVQNNTF